MYSLDVHVTAYGRQTVPYWGVVGSCDSLAISILATWIHITYKRGVVIATCYIWLYLLYLRCR